ncbi:MAG: hypothetical protein A2Y64_00550 [Candidatus Coatesbacteria bacterium RBG_13_66_14]|uniref:Uncharacterized protein n=1 Tax=Candidatus Coatesbacteria bacterium RBG_13_66_14 TaxID=1817816 RepID=A0A1F5EYW9_9BACT|nr:MAG: hypothetical protein A2Y64_00550 [Candidatus Coatesbacteria bacterium RBG_13_66_14]
MPRIIIVTLMAAVIIGGCGRSVYDELTRYKNEATPADAELQACLDAYTGRRLHLGEGYGYRLPFDSVETRELLRRAEKAEEELKGIGAPEPSEASYAPGKTARLLAEEKIAAAEDIRGAFELLDEVTREWEDRLPTGPPPEGDTETVELAPGDVEAWRDDMARVDGVFESAERNFDDAALALGAAILAAHDDEY